MAYQDLREWISTLESEGLLSRIKCEVDWNRELAAIVRTGLSKKGPALFFENIKEYRLLHFHSSLWQQTMEVCKIDVYTLIL